RVGHHAVGADVIRLPLVGRADADLAGGDDLALRVDDAGHVHRRELERFQGARVDVDLHLAEDAAEDRGGGQALDVGQLVADGRVGQVEQFAVVAAVAGDDQLPDRDGAGVELEDRRRQHAGGHELHLAVDEGDDLAGGDVGIDLRAEVNSDNAD